MRLVSPEGMEQVLDGRYPTDILDQSRRRRRPISMAISPHTRENTDLMSEPFTLHN